jgi:hypothetical protein
MGAAATAGAAMIRANRARQGKGHPCTGTSLASESVGSAMARALPGGA